MSVIVGLLKEPEAQVTEEEMRRLLAPTERYGTGAPAIYLRARLGMGFQPYATHERSILDDRPADDSYRNAISFDGRLDNYKELALTLQLDPVGTSDTRIVLAAFRRWGEECFSRLTGDWALALWCERERKLFLARDHAGTRTLYFSDRPGVLHWSTHLDSFLQSRFDLKLSEEYVARYLSGSPLGDLTPYEGIRSIRPAHYCVFRENARFESAHWSPATAMPVHYRQDIEYEQHFLELFLQAVARRTGGGAPILAELSGGMDSTSIVCASDFLRLRDDSGMKLLDTVSYYDDSEASLDERRHFTITESNRGKTGTHLEIAFSERTFSPHDGSQGLYAMPGSDNKSIVREQRFEEQVWKRGFRSILSGIGGDELLGGVPDPCPELSSLLVDGQWSKLFTQGVAWSLVERSPLVKTIGHTLRYTADLYTRSSFPCPPPKWLSQNLRKMVTSPRRLGRAISRLKHTPRQLDNERTWWAVMETLTHLFPRILSRPEYRYPILDKDLVNYLHGVPSEQLLRPDRRRSLMRRALVGIVPEEILERKRKGFQLSGPMRAFQEHEKTLQSLFARPISAEYGFISRDSFVTALHRACSGDATEWQAILRGIALELWLQSAARTSTPFGKTEDENLAA